ncbi:hypothetical protein C8N46_107234 [Kordia periserrulae]|uniref:GLPGLI family protein n=1 Tax=Kordia periserrulae TaxID=701523 RepID=A0A2T6BW87_9FLAO|nr:hypothetical protein [Kordia periserrulae]PTX60227.1 hypothetical protein C8N46_107234 [Kordia periserrulae]
MKKVVFSILLLLSSMYLYSQDQPKHGTIVFESCEYIANKHLAPSEQEKKLEKERMRNSIKKNLDEKNPDEFINSIPKTYIQTYGDSLKCTYTLDIYKNVYEAKKTCDYFKKSTNEIYEQLNRETLEYNVVNRDINTNTYTIFPKRKNYQFSISDTHEITEYRKETKKILGYDCFKIVLKRKNLNGQRLDVFNIEMFVTEEIKLNYSPIIKYKDILDKYYPLEVTKKPKIERMIEVITWKAKRIEIENI